MSLGDRLISPHGFDGNGPVPDQVRDAAKRIAQLRVKFNTEWEEPLVSPLTWRDTEELFEAAALQAEWMRELYEALHDDPTPETFVLDLAENPHPKMLEGALQARRTARALGGDRELHYFAGYIQAMADATGETVEALNKWLDRHSGESSFDGSATRVELRRRK